MNRLRMERMRIGMVVIGLAFGALAFRPATAQDVKSCWENETPGAICAEETTGMEFVYVPGGCSKMGSTLSKSEQPVHEVCLKGFWMGKYEVTQAQWKTIMGNNPAAFKDANRPVETVSWNDVQEFLRKLNATVETHGRASLQFRLPSEAEWEYAARARKPTTYSFGDDKSALGEYAWYAANSGNKTHPVGEKKPNDFGLYDIHGNVYEWCADLWHENYMGAPTDGSAWGDVSDGEEMVKRSGAWNTEAFYFYRATRYKRNPAYRSSNIGFRVVASRTK